MTTTPDTPAHRSEPRSLVSDEAVLERAAADLAGKFTGIFAPQTVRRYVFDSHTTLAAPPGSRRTWCR